ncbi:TVP38/TMEM64 family protein [Candidatus Omnitrophota bacterium]
MQNSKKKAIVKSLVFLLIVGIIFISGKYLRGSEVIPQVLQYVERLGFWAPVFFTLIYILISGVVIPAVILNIITGTLFGIFWGMMIVTVGSAVSSSIKFFLARYLLRESITRKIERNDKLKAIDQIIEKDGWKILLILRNVPVVNSMLLNYICGITRMKFMDFTVASVIGRLPLSAVCVYLGYVARYAYITELSAHGMKHPVVEKAALLIGLAAVTAATVYLIHLSRKVLARRAPSVVAQASAE